MLDVVLEAVPVALEVALDPVLAVVGSLEVGLGVLPLMEVMPNDNHK